MHRSIKVTLCALVALSAWYGNVQAQSDCIFGQVLSENVPVQNVRIKLIAPGKELVTFTNLQGFFRVCASSGSYQLIAEWGRNRIEEQIVLQGSQQKNLYLKP